MLQFQYLYYPENASSHNSRTEGFRAYISHRSAGSTGERIPEQQVYANLQCCVRQDGPLSRDRQYKRRLLASWSSLRVSASLLVFAGDDDGCM